MTALLPKPRVKLVKQGKQYTYEDMLRLTPRDSGNYELHDGKIFFMPSPLVPHQIASSNLHIELGAFAKRNKLGRVLAAPMDVRFTENDIVQPDLMFIANERADIIQKIVEGAPDLVVEIKSESNTPKELGYKKFLYETGGVKEYWLVDVEAQTVKQYLLKDDEFLLQKVYTPTDTLRAVVLEGFEITIAAIFA
jgi:Uma2 family endonuclease